MTTAPPLVEAHDLQKMYEGGGGVPALRGATMTVAPGEMVAIMGPSGCGKSALLRLLGGLDVPSSARRGRAVSGSTATVEIADRA